MAGDGSTATLGGTRLKGMSVEVYEGDLIGSGVSPASDPACVDMNVVEAQWSCLVSLPGGAAESPTVFSVRYVPNLDDEVWGGYTISSNFRRVVLEQPTPEPTPTPSPEPTATPSPEPTAPEPTSPAEPTPKPTPKPTPLPAAAAPIPPTSSQPSSTGTASPVGEQATGSHDPNQDTGDSPEPAAEGSDPTPPSVGAGRPPTAAPEPASAPEPTSAPLPQPTGGQAVQASGPFPAEQAGGIAAPSHYGHALTTPEEITDIPPAAVVGAAVTAAAFLLFVALPSELLHATLRSNYARTFVFMAGFRRGWDGLRRRIHLSVPAWLAAGGVLALGSVIATLATGRADGPAVVLRMVLAMFFAFITTNGAGVALGWAVGNRYAARPRVKLMPGFLVLTAFSVVVSRLFGLEPIIMFGIMIMAGFGRRLNRVESGVYSAAICATFTGIGILAWLGYGLIDPQASGFATEFLREYLTTVLTGVIGYCIVALLPLTYLDGARIFRWSKRVWALLYAIVIVIFLLTVTPLPSSWQTASASTMWWSATFGTFGVISIAVWAWFRFRPSPTGQDADRERQKSGT